MPEVFEAMKCLNCQTIVSDKDPYCPVCHKPANRSKWMGPKATAKVTTCSVLFLAIGVAIFNVFAKKWFPTPPGGGINWEQAMWAGVVGAASAVVGALIGSCLGGPGGRD